MNERRRVMAVGESQQEFVSEDFEYIGGVQTITLPAGKYKLECWGAQGGSYDTTYYGGKGGYSVGTIELEEETLLYIYVGGQGTGGTTTGTKAGGFNGGGDGYSSNTTYIECGGGGASDIRIGQDSLYARVIVAGGGGGAGSYSTSARYAGGAGGGTSGLTPSQYSTSYRAGTGGTQTARGTSYYGSTANSSNYGTLAAFGVGASALSGKTYQVTGGGGGWYGGGYSRRGAGGGGSGYVYNASTSSSYPSGCLLDSGCYLSDAETKAGDTSFNDPSGNSETGHSGNGHVRISNVSIYDVVLRVKNSQGTAIQGLDITVETPSGIQTVATDSQGEASFSAKGRCTISSTQYLFSISSFNVESDMTLDIEAYNGDVPDAGQKYTFSIYTNTAGNNVNFGFGYCGNDPTLQGDDNHIDWSYEDANSTSGTYSGCNRIYATFTVPSNKEGYYKIEVYNDSETNFAFYRPQLEVGEEPTAWESETAKNYSSEIKQTADSIDLSIRHDLAETGIYIDGASKKIDMQADKFTLKNSSGQKTLGVNADGDFEVSGIVKANSLYRTVAICISSESINILEAGGSTKRCIFIKSLTESPDSQELADRYGFNVEDYFYLTPAMITSGEFDDGIFMGDFVVCTGNADIILPMDNYNANYLENRNKWRDGTWVRLPEASHCAGKVVEIRHHLTQGDGSIVISTVKQTAYAIVFAPMINDDMQISYNRGYDSGASAYFQWPAGTIIPLYSNGSNWISLGSIRNVNT